MMTTVDRSIFRKYDIRGIAAGDAPQLTPGVALLVGKALGTYLPRHFQSERVFVGSDNRLTSGPLKAAVIEGLASTGLPVTDIGEVLTPTVYFASASYDGNGAGVMNHRQPPRHALQRDQDGLRKIGARWRANSRAAPNY